MKSFISLAFLTLVALVELSAASAVQRKPRSALSLRADECEFTECIVSLAELPLQITTCIEALNDINEAAEDPQNSDPIKTATQGADCIAEASLAAVELPSHCSGCTKVLDGECPQSEIPCTGPPSK
ncbi:hypothetical protein PUNSTDRAFT_133589 [Punctularia strigosozonata HHB-11173 SS5]|uniref:uncharacterized protein n=1 Tax=Punctularia strigosozonata (strain HHB-11173) TaxID=741275 RepID=UPI000441873D|nr:uncharacterized protein PUNSTDRAFT_133589 [Punctularia strigosozonata HHB-11173 SS5]EIN09817.1 hypothetical protein PUNSTDRAFT_133589 [Punctularia strigosozonata HHB-11173 SS5]